MKIDARVFDRGKFEEALYKRRMDNRLADKGDELSIWEVKEILDSLSVPLTDKKHSMKFTQTNYDGAWPEPILKGKTIKYYIDRASILDSLEKIK